MKGRELIFRIHAIERMAQRRVTVSDIQAALDQGQRIEEYPNDHPFPSALVYYQCGTRLLHVVVAENTLENQAIIITVYEPDTETWEPDFRTRKARS